MSDPFDPILRDWLAEGPEQGPREPLARTLAAARRSSQRPAWLVPTPSFAGGSTLPRLSVSRRAVVVTAVGGLVLALVLGTLLVASRPRVPRPFGPAANGLIAFQTSSRIHVSDADGGNVRPLTAGSLVESGPAFSQDGGSIAFWSGSTVVGPHDLMVAAADGSGARSATRGWDVRPQDLAAAPDWSPDGTMLAFTGRVDGVAGLFVARADGSGIQPLAGASAGSTADEPRWSPDGQWIAFRTTAPAAIELAVMRADGSGVRRLVSQPASDGSERIFQGFTWAPDSTRLAYQYLGPDGGDVAIVDLEGHVTPVADDPGSEFNPAWSPDGAWIAFMADNGEALDMARPDGRDRRSIGRGLFDGNGCRLFWSPDGTTILGSEPGASCSPTNAGHVKAVRVDDSTTTFRIEAPVGGLPAWQRSPP